MSDDDGVSPRPGDPSPTALPVGWQVELDVDPGCVDALRGLTEQMVAVAAGEPGTMTYLRIFSADGTVMHALEQYIDAQAAVVHLETFNDTFAAAFLALVTRRRCTVFGDTTPLLRTLLEPLNPTYLPAVLGFWHR